MDVKSVSERLSTWPQGLAQSSVPEARRQQYRQAIESFLAQVGQDPLKIRCSKARQFMAEAIHKHVVDSQQVDVWKEALTQRQALNAIVFLLREVFGKELGDFSYFKIGLANFMRFSDEGKPVYYDTWPDLWMLKLGTRYTVIDQVQFCPTAPERAASQVLKDSSPEG